jgi:hypothetical protein
MTRVRSGGRVRIAGPIALVAILIAAIPARAQEPPPPIPRIALDVHATVPRFPQDVNLADSRGLSSAAELPGTGIGGQLAVHVYPLKWRAITFGLGGELVGARAKYTPPEATDTTQAVTETFRTLDAQLSLNFGSGSGWSYLSGGVGRSNLSIVAEGREPLDTDNEVLKTINYGGGARWFAKPHLAFSFDVRFYALNPGTPSFGFPGSPRMRFLSIGAGVSLKP